MADAGVSYCFMETSSHGIDQRRTKGIEFAGAVFTNLTHDHLDYHGTFAAYRDTKKRLFDDLLPTAFALTNVDDKNGRVMLQNTKAKKVTYGLKSYADYNGKVLEQRFDGQLLKLDQHELWVRLIGHFNAYNLLAIYGVAQQLGFSATQILPALSSLETVDGRFQQLISPNKVNAIVDYAHTPDALKNVLQTINGIVKPDEKIITVIGCGGGRDKAKRPKMGSIAAQLSHRVIFTADNPRNEEVIEIIEEMQSGLTETERNKVLVIENRAEAIKVACLLALPNDVVLVAGKGHETYQEINGERFDFSDFKVIKEVFNQTK